MTYHWYLFSQRLISNLLDIVGLKPLYQIVFENRLSLIHKYVHGTRHLPPNTITLKRSTNKRFMSRNNHDLAIDLPKCNFSRFSSSALVSTATAFNLITSPANIVQKSKSVFRKFLVLRDTFIDITNKISLLKSKIVAILNI